MLTMSKLCKSSKLSRAELNKQLQKIFGISQPSVSEWWRKGIPASRQIEIVKRFKLDPRILTK